MNPAKAAKMMLIAKASTSGPERKIHNLLAGDAASIERLLSICDSGICISFIPANKIV
jgi:hypothetical protein